MRCVGVPSCPLRTSSTRMASLATNSEKYKKRDKIYYRQDRQHSSRPGYIEVCAKEGGYSLRLEWNGTIVSQPKVSAADARTHLRAADPNSKEYKDHAKAWMLLEQDCDARCDKG